MRRADHVILPNAVFIPAYNFEEQCLHAGDGEHDDFIPLRVEVFRDGGRRIARVAETDVQVLLRSRLVSG